MGLIKHIVDDEDWGPGPNKFLISYMVTSSFDLGHSVGIVIGMTDGSTREFILSSDEMKDLRAKLDYAIKSREDKEAKWLPLYVRMRPWWYRLWWKTGGLVAWKVSRLFA